MTSAPGPQGSQGYYPQQAYYAPGWQAPATAPPPRRGPRTSTLVLWLLIGVLVLGVLAGGGYGLRFWLATRPLGDVDGPVRAGVHRLAVGNCIAELPEDGAVGSVTVVPCADPHTAEVVGVHQVRVEGPFPGDEAVTREVAASCEMDADQRAGGFRPVVWTPTAGSWAQGDREGLCLAALADGSATGSFTDGDEVRTDP